MYSASMYDDDNVRFSIEFLVDLEIMKRKHFLLVIFICM